jgi:hypothetical protein
MGKYLIPKLSRNKFGYIKGVNNNNYITQSQLMMSSGGAGGNGSGLSSSQVQQQINDTLADKGYVSYTYLKTINGYSLIGEGDIEVTGGGTVDLSAYATKTYVADYVNTYSPTPDLSAYVTKVELDTASYMNAYVLPQNDYDNLSTADKNKNTIYLISDQTAYEYNELVTVQEMNDTINSYGFLTSANFEYDSNTGTLTMRI